MNLLVKLTASMIISTAATCAYAAGSTNVICTYAPSQSEKVRHIVSLTTGAVAGAEITLLASGLTIVPHSSALPILTGSSGYIAGTMTGALVTTTVITAGLVIGGTVVTFELACAPTNHPELVEKVIDGAREYTVTAGNVIRNATLKSRSVSKDKLDDLADLIKRYQKITNDKFYEIMGETWYERAFRKAKEGLGIS